VEGEKMFQAGFALRKQSGHMAKRSEEENAHFILFNSFRNPESLYLWIACTGFLRGDLPAWLESVLMRNPIEWKSRGVQVRKNVLRKD
jgi:hypothetical protein